MSVFLNVYLNQLNVAQAWAQCEATTVALGRINGTQSDWAMEWVSRQSQCPTSSVTRVRWSWCWIGSCLVPHLAATSCSAHPRSVALTQAAPQDLLPPDTMAALMVANGLVPFVAFFGTVAYEFKALGILGKKKTSSAAVAPAEEPGFSASPMNRTVG